MDKDTAGDMELEGRYRLDRLVGNGATAEVWRGYDALLRRPVAVRLLRPDRPERAERFLAAGRTAARLTHPNVAAVYDVGVAELPQRGATPFVVMELADGPSLAARLAAGPLDPPETARIGAEVAAALAEAHGRWVSHGTLGPAKVVLTDVGAKVVGFAGDMLDDPDGASADVRALGALLAACFDDRPGHQPCDELAAVASRCLSPEPALRPSSDEAALTLARIAGAAVDLPAFLTAGVETRAAATVALRGRPRTRARGRMRWTVRAAVASAGAAALLLGAVAALGQVGPGGMPWFSHPAEVAAVPPGDDRPCADAALDPRACVPAAVPSQPAATTIVPVPRPTSRSPKPSVSRTTGPAPSPSSAPASPSPSSSPSPSTPTSTPESSAPPSPPPSPSATPSHSASTSSAPSGTETASDSPATH
ncbi:protein kinase [Dactylosporangium sp. NPDC000555]|uniref:protein kinase n=1 Tax=Dactylosporangium sp. NPDC000555 TaxID=3154260 RepID=UPI0033292EB2